MTEQIYRGFRDAVRTGLLPSGTRLPSTRRLAAILKVARNTVSTAYELLQAEGITTVRAGAAPRITEGLRLEGGGGCLLGAGSRAGSFGSR
ncbi:GntR family transcriptional regulator [Roseibium salinum]|nr:GntR family transcriptional regulator [Roseibium salinum]